MQTILQTIRTRSAGLKLSTKAAMQAKDWSSLRNLATLHRMLLADVESAIALCNREMTKADL